MDRMFDDDHCAVRINWSRPVDLAELKGAEDENDLIYLITAKTSRGAEKMIYVGQAYSQKSGDRIRQPDHRRKQLEWSARFAEHKLQIRKGRVHIENGKISVPKINAIESMLIYCLDTDHCVNLRANRNPKISGRYEICNVGSKAGLPRRIGFGFYVG